MAIVEIIVLNKVSAIHFCNISKGIAESVWKQEKQYLGIPKNRYQVQLNYLSCKLERFCMVHEGESL